jgi:hypothetical protein
MLLLTLLFLPLPNHTCFIIVIYLKHHFIILILHLINMESSNLSYLSSDFWIDIGPFLTSIEVGRLSMIGCKLLFDKIISGISSFVYHPRLQRYYSLPSLFFSFPNLLHLNITLPSSYSNPEWRKLDLFDISLLPKSLKSLNLDLDCVGNGKWLYDWLSSSLSTSGMTLESLLPNLTSFTFTNQSWKNRPNSTDYLLPLLSLPLTRLSLPSPFHILPSHLSFLNHHTLLDLEIALPNDVSSSSIIFPPNLTRFHIYNLPINFPLILLPRTLLGLHIKFAPHGGDDDDDDDDDDNDDDDNDDMGRNVDPEQLKDWPPNLTKLSIFFDNDTLTEDLYLTSTIASSLPRTLTSLNWEIDFSEDPNVLQEMPPNLIECSTMIQNEKELISESIPLLPKTLTSIQSTYLHVPSLWKYLPKTITSIEFMGWLTPNFNIDSSPFIQDLPPLLTYLQSYISFFQPSCPMLENITRLSIRLNFAESKEDRKLFFNIISTQLPHLESLDLGWNDFVDGSLLDILQRPLKTLKLTCDPCTLNFISGKWSQSLQVLHVRTSDDFESPQMDISAFIEQRDPNWHLPATLTELHSIHSLILFSPSSPQLWPPNLTHIYISNLELNNSTILWTSLPSSLIKLEFLEAFGEIDLLSNPSFIDSLKHLPPGIISFRLDHQFYRPSNKRTLYRGSTGKFCFPKSILDLAKTHPRLACFKICKDELDLSRIDCNPSSTWMN